MPTPSVYYELSTRHNALMRKSYELIEAVTAFCHVYEGRTFDPEADYEAMKQIARDFYDGDAMQFYPEDGQ